MYDNDVDKLLEQSKEPAMFIEAQLWNDKYLKDYLMEEKEDVSGLMPIDSASAILGENRPSEEVRV